MAALYDIRADIRDAMSGDRMIAIPILLHSPENPLESCDPGIRSDTAAAPMVDPLSVRSPSQTTLSIVSDVTDGAYST